MSNIKPASGDWKANATRNSTLLAFWTFAWLLTMALAVFGPELFWQSNRLATISAIVVNLAIGAGMIMANIKHLKGLDELHQKVQLEAMALALGVAVIVGLSYSNLDVTNIIEFDAEISHLVFLIGITYGISVAVGLRKYQ
jgi:hypothetical protein